MPRFEYSALSAAGDLVTGELEGADAPSVIRVLNEQTLFPIHAAEKRAQPTAFSWRFRRTRALPGAELALFSQQLARLLKAGLPLDRALGILADLIGRKRSAAIVGRVLERVRDGSSLAEAMEAQSGAFPTSYVSMIRAGEIGGALQGVLTRVAEFLTRAAAIRERVVSAMIYPAILLVVATGAVGMILTVVLPQFEPVFEEAGAQLPAITRFVMALGHGLRDDWWILLLAGLVAVLAFQQGMRHPAVAARKDRLALALPIVGGLITRFEIGRFSRTLGVLLASGVPAPRALALCGDTVGNRAVSSAIGAAAVRFKEGQGLSEPLARTGRFPDLAVQLIRIGEETGKLEEMLQEVAEIYDQEVRRALDRLLTLLVPVITITMGAAIAGIIAAVMLAMLSINDLAV